MANTVTVSGPKKRLEAWAEIRQMVDDEAPRVLRWHQHDIYNVAGWIEWSARADEKVWMFEVKVGPR